MDLFGTDAQLVALPLPDGELAWIERLPLPYAQDDTMARLIAETPWREETVTVFGKRHLQPRLTAWYGDKSYRYSGLTLPPLAWTPLLTDLRAAVEAASGRRFNSVLLNYYRDGRDSMGMHSDNERELGPEPAIASLSLGATRVFVLRHKRTGETRKLELPGGSLLLMSGKTQDNWLHGIPKSSRTRPPRLNLTFRYIV